MSRKLRKPFSGKLLVKYLRKKPPANQENRFDKDSSINYAQKLLEANFIILVEIKSKRFSKMNI